MATVTEEEKAALLGQMMAMQVCIRALVASNPGLEVFQILLPAARDESLRYLASQSAQHSHPSHWGTAALQLDHLLYILTSGLFGERPGMPE